MDENPSDLYKICGRAPDCFESGRFSPCNTTREKEIAQQIVTCKLVHASEPTNHAEKFVCVNYP